MTHQPSPISSVPFGAIFDWDGVIIDSADYHRQSWERYCAESGRKLNDTFFKKGFGMKNEFIIPNLLNWSHDPVEIRAIADRKEEHYRDILREQGATALPGVVAWLEMLRAANVPCVIASSTVLENITCALDVLGVRSFFADIVSSRDVTHGKPHPEVFLIAARKLGMEPARCIVFEDAHVGIEAARAAQIKVIAVTTTHPAHTLTDANLVVARLDELTVGRVAQLLA